MTDLLKPGDLVVLKGGSPPLTVTRAPGISNPEAMVEVTWWADAGDEIKSMDLPLAALAYLSPLDLVDDFDDQPPADGGTTH